MNLKWYLVSDGPFLFLFLFLGLFLLIYWDFHTLPPLERNALLMSGVKGERSVGEERKATQTTLILPRHLQDPCVSDTLAHQNWRTEDWKKLRSQLLLQYLDDRFRIWTVCLQAAAAAAAAGAMWSAAFWAHSLLETIHWLCPVQLRPQ